MLDAMQGSHPSSHLSGNAGVGDSAAGERAEGQSRTQSEDRALAVVSAVDAPGATAKKRHTTNILACFPLGIANSHRIL